MSDQERQDEVKEEAVEEEGVRKRKEDAEKDQEDALSGQAPDEQGADRDDAGDTVYETGDCEFHGEGQPIEADDLDPNFKYEISEQPGGENIKSCFQCGSCSAVCVVGAVDPCYDPRKIIRMALLGMREEVLQSEFIWLCSVCYVCHERCPQGVMITDLIGAIQTIAVKEGYVHPLINSSLDLLEEHGRLIEVGSFENKMRKKLGLPEIDESSESTQEIIDRLGIRELVPRGGEEAEEGKGGS